MTILVFGKTGQVAKELARFDGVTCLGRDQADLTDPDSCNAVIAASDATAVINAAAYTAVDKAEEDPETAIAVNTIAPTAMATAAAAKSIPFVQISTDYVFDGSGKASRRPEEATGPLGVYGASKLGGENGIKKVDGVYAILRTSWVFSIHGNNFLKTMLRLSQTRNSLSVVADQIGGPTPAEAIADACIKIARTLETEPNKGGIYHLSGTPDVSWAEFACEIFKAAQRDVAVEAIPTRSYDTLAARPLNSRLDCATLSAVFGVERPDWRRASHRIVKALT